MQLERILRSQGLGSRPECRGLIRQGRVRIDGTAAEDPFAEHAVEGFRFNVDEREFIFRSHAYVLLNKPGGFECSHRPRFHRSVYALLPDFLITRAVQAVGRLDEDTTGLLLLSDDGQFIHTYTSPKKKVGKVYDVSLKHPLDTIQVDALRAGVQLVDEVLPVAATDCEPLAERVLRLTVSEGKYHLVKRMIAAAGNRVLALNRVRVGGLHLPAGLAPGEWMWLEADDLQRLANPYEKG